MFTNDTTQERIDELNEAREFYAHNYVADKSRWAKFRHVGEDRGATVYRAHTLYWRALWRRTIEQLRRIDRTRMLITGVQQAAGRIRGA